MSSMDKGKATLKSNAEQHKVLTQQIEAQKERVQKLAYMVEESTKKYGEADTRTLKWKEALNEATTSLNLMEQKLKTLPNQIELVGKKMEEAGKKIKAVGDKISGLGDKLTTRVTLPIAAAATKAVNSFAEVDKTLTLTNKTMGNSAEAAKKLQTAMKNAASRSTFSMEEAANATLSFARAGLDAEEAAAALAPAMNLAAGEAGDLERVSAGLVGAINGFGDSFENTSHYADVFAAACNNSALDVDSLSDAMGIAAPVFRTAGKEIEDAALYLGIMADANIDANTAANALKTGMMRLAAPTKQAREAMAEYNIESSAVWGPDGSMKDAVEIQKNLHDSFAGLTEQEQLAAAAAIFGKNQGAAWLALINTAPEEVDALAQSIGNCNGVTQEMSDAMMSGFGGSMEKLKASIDVAVYSFGEALAPTISKVADALQKAVDWFNSLDEEERQQIAQTALIVAAAGPVLSIVGRMTSGIGSLVSAGGSLLQGGGSLIKMLSGSGGLTAAAGEATAAAEGTAGALGTAGASAAALAAPVAIAIGALAALTAAFITAYNEDEKFANEVDEAWQRIQNSVQSVIDVIKPAWEEFSEAISPVFLEAMDTVSETLDRFAQNAQGWIDLIRGIFEGDWNTILSGFENLAADILNRIIGKFEDFKNKIEGIFSRLNIQLPHIKLPHFRVESSDSFGLPKFKIDWYAKAMNNGLRLTDATIFGEKNGKLLGGGEAGNEWIIGENSLFSMIRSAVESSVGGRYGGNSVTVGETTINVYGAPGQDVNELAEEIDRLIGARTNRIENAWA